MRTTFAGPLGTIRRVIAVVGCQRSGTTLSGQILGAHPQALLVDEYDGLYRWFHAQTNDPANADDPAHTMVEAARAKYREPAARFRAADGRVALAPAVSVLVLKAPNLTYDDDAFARLGMPATIVYPMRDPRAVVASMKRLSHIDFVGNQMRLMCERPRIAERYACDVRTLQDAAVPPWVRQATVWRVKSGRAPDFEARSLKVSRFRYEDLVHEPDAVIARVLADCELTPSGCVERWTSAYTGTGPGGTDRTRAIDASSLASWRAVLSPAQQSDVLAAAAPLAAANGYR
jgi:hypothetical protein